MSIRRVLTALSAVVFTAFSAPAADAQVLSGPWQGLYLGAHGGFGSSSSGDPVGDGWVGGLQAGYNFQFGAAVLGVEADYTWGGIDGSTRVSSLPVSGKVDSLWSVRARLGWSFANSFMIYGTAGYGGFDTSISTLAGAVTTRSGSFDALVLGGGAELLLTRSLMLRAEGLHYAGNAASSWTTDGDVTIFRLGASYKF